MGNLCMSFKDLIIASPAIPGSNMPDILRDLHVRGVDWLVASKHMQE